MYMILAVLFLYNFIKRFPNRIEVDIFSNNNILAVSRFGLEYLIVTDLGNTVVSNNNGLFFVLVKNNIYLIERNCNNIIINKIC